MIFLRGMIMLSISYEYELNRGWLYDENDEVIGETNFVVSAEFVEKMYSQRFRKMYETLEIFLEAYIPEEDGEYIYQKAKENEKLIEGSCINYY